MMKHLGEDSKRENCCYHDLAPVDSIDSEEESIQALRWAIKNPKVHNIALSGPYGSGKSSVIQSYLRQYDVSKRYKRLERCSLLKKLRILNLVSKSSGENLRISLATFDGNLLEKEDAKDELQKGILKQLFYKVDASKIPLSRYRKLHHIKGYRYVLAIVLSLLLIVAGGYLIFPQNVLSFWNQYWDGVNGAEKAFRIVTAIVFLVGISYLLWMFTSRFRIKSISVGDITAEGKNITEESILDRNMDEILYFFEKTKYRVVFIEDLDRFNNTEIFVNLRELNEILNNYEVIKKCGKVAFVYAVRDDLFAEETERTKFFDFMIPVIPVINSTNSDEVMKQLLGIGEKPGCDVPKVSHEISEDFIKQIYPFISNMRTLINVINEFWIYKRKLKKDSADKLDDEKIMALMVYKNLYPKDFAELEDERGLIKDAFDSKDKLIKSRKEWLIKEKEELSKLQKDATNSVREIKILILSELLKNVPAESAIISYEVCMDNDTKRYTESEILKDEFSMEVFRQDKVKVRINYKVCSYYSREGSTDWIVEPECISEKMKELFERYDLYKKYEIYSMDKIKAKLVQTGENLQRVRSMSIQQMLEDKDDREQLPENVKNNILLMFLLQRGYINENYADYINYFREGSISRSELNFIRTVRSRQGICDFEFVIRHHANVIEKLFDYEFEQVELLNYSLMDYMLQHCADSSQMQKLLGQVTNRTVKSKQFIKDYLSRGKFVAEFVKRIAAISMYIWEDIAEDIELTQDRQLSYLNDLLSYAYIEDLKKNDYEIDYEENGPNEPVQRSITRYICEVPDIFKRMSDVPTEKWIQIISALDVIFVRVTLQKIDKKIVNAIIKKHAFELNHHMIEEIFKITKPEYLPVLFKKNYYCIRKLSNREIVEYVDERMIDYVENIILGEQTNTEEDKDAVEIILKSLLDNKINDKDPGMYSLCGEVLKKEHLAYWETFEDFLGNYEEDTIELWEYLLRYGRITASWENCIAYYEATGEIDDALYDFIDAKIDDILIDQRNHEKVRGEKFEPPHEFFKALITSDILEDTFYKLITTFEIITFDCKCDEFSENRLRMMIQMSYIPFDLEKLNELKNISLELWMIYVANNKSDFLDNLSQERLEIEDIKNLLKADIFEADESKLVLEEIDATEIDKELAEILVSFSEKTIFEESYVEAVWENLPEDRRYEWLYNQMEVYDLDELAEHFAQLEKTYLQFVDRDRRHKYKVYNTEYNAKLCAKLKEIGFVTGVKNTGEWLEGYVKKRG